MTDDFIKGIVTHDGRTMCNKCKKILKISDEIYTDGSRTNFDLCKTCHGEEI